MSIFEKIKGECHIPAHASKVFSLNYTNCTFVKDQCLFLRNIKTRRAPLTGNQCFYTNMFVLEEMKPRRAPHTGNPCLYKKGLFVQEIHACMKRYYLCKKSVLIQKNSSFFFIKPFNCIIFYSLWLRLTPNHFINICITMT